jgi:hypothetical protein
MNNRPDRRERFIGYLRAIGRFHHYSLVHREPTDYADFFKKMSPYVRTRHIRLRLNYGKGNSTLQGRNVEPSRCHNAGMKAKVDRNKSESK